MAAVVLAGATAAVPLMVPGVTGAPVAAPVLLTADYDRQPQPGVLLDLKAMLDWQPTGADVAAADWAGPVGWVWPLPASPGLLVVPSRSFVEGFRTDVVAVVVEPDGTERWRVTNDGFTDLTTQQCTSSVEVVTCWGDDGDGTAAVLQLDVQNGAVLAERTLSDAAVTGTFTNSTDVLVLREGTDLARYRLIDDEDMWSVEVNGWITDPASLWGYQFVDSQFVLNTSGGGALFDPDNGRLLWRTTGHLSVVEGRYFEIDWNAEKLSRLDDLGLPLWSTEGATSPSWFDGDPVVTQDGIVRRLDADTGEIRWSASDQWSDGWVGSGPDLAWMTSGSGGRSRVLDPSTGTPGAEFEGMVIAAERGRLYLQDTMSAENPRLQADTVEGDQLWELELADLIPGRFPNTMVLAGRLVVQTDSHLLFLEP